MVDYRKVADLVNRYDLAVDGLEADVIERLNESIDASYRQLERELRQRWPVWQAYRYRGHRHGKHRA